MTIPFQPLIVLLELRDRGVHGADLHLHALQIGARVGGGPGEGGELLAGRRIAGGGLVLGGGEGNGSCPLRERLAGDSGTNRGVLELTTPPNVLLYKSLEASTATMTLSKSSSSRCPPVTSALADRILL
jgi:hypothetical protein